MPLGPMNKVGGHRYLLGWHESVLDMGHARDEILTMPDSEFFRYENPFEKKWALKTKEALTPGVQALVHWMESELLTTASEEFEVGLYRDPERHYLGVFKYDPGDHLSVHVDAGIHPVVGSRKHVTCVLYLGQGKGDLEFWRGHRCTETHPRINSLMDSIPPDHGRLVLFENSDYAWHGAAVNTGTEPRLVVTVSYLSSRIYDFENTRQRAYFIKRPAENWTSDMYDLRDKRSDSKQYSEAYRVN